MFNTFKVKLYLIVIACFISLNVIAIDTLLLNSYQQQQYDQLINELRCVTCPNQSIADSMAPIATAMKEDVVQRILSGQTSQQIQQALIDNYGDYVIYKPPFKARTLILWLGPFILLGLVFGIWSWLSFRSRRQVSM